MMRILIAAAVVALLGGVPATAQYGGGFGGGYGGGGSGYRGGWDDEDEWRERRRERRREYRDYGGGGYGPPRMSMGSLCVTSRGSCPTPRGAAQRALRLRHPWIRFQARRRPVASPSARAE